VASIIGIDIGTTSIKCSTVLLDGHIVDLQCKTPPFELSSHDSKKITFSPAGIWKAVESLLTEIIHTHSLDKVIISVVSQAPSICLWDDNENATGVSYLSFYGNPQENNYELRRSKANNRISLAKQLFPTGMPGYISCLTGYIVYKLTGELTIDSITAWELGIESETDEIILDKGIHKFAKVYPPTRILPMLSKNLPGIYGTVLVGTTDSAVLPLSTFPTFHDYYVYLGTWGSLLCSRLKNVEDYKLNYHSGQVHKWLISIPNFINECQHDLSSLESLFAEVFAKTEDNCSIAVCGGLTKAYARNITELAQKYWGNRNYTVSPIKNSTIGAYKLGAIATDEVIK